MDITVVIIQWLFILIGIGYLLDDVTIWDVFINN